MNDNPEYISVDAIPWETGDPRQPNLSPTTTKRRQKAARGKDPAMQKMGRNSRKRGLAFETWLKRDLEAEGWTVYQQGGRGQRDLHAEKHVREGEPQIIGVGTQFLNAYQIKDVGFSYCIEAKSHAKASDLRMTFGPTLGERERVLQQAKEKAQQDEEPVGIIKYTRQGLGQAIFVVSLDHSPSETYEEWKARHR